MIYRQLCKKRNSPMINKKTKQIKIKNIKLPQKILSLLLSVCAIYSALGIQCFADSGIKAQSEPKDDTVCAYLSVSNEEDIKVGSRLKDLFFGKGDDKDTRDELYLCPGGDAFGVKICGCEVTVTKVISEISSGMLHVDDKILSIDGKEISSIKDVKDMLDASGGKELNFEIMRKGKKLSLNITPKDAGGEYHLGVILSDGASGIGTITYYDPTTKEFGGLGHGICSSDGAKVLKMTRGDVTGVVLAGASKGETNKPGELRGVLTDKILGELTANTECGVFGYLAEDSSFASSQYDPIPIAKRDEVNEGEATIICTVKSGRRAEYSVRLEDIDRSSTGTKSFRIKVTDDALIALTGGIVRGMSGSPIIQDGKLVGAVTHVLVGDPTEGYGIFIENMLNAANNSLQKAA